MSSYLGRFVVAVGLLGALSFFVESTSAAAFKHTQEGDEAPAFSLPDAEGKSLELAAFHGDGPLTILVFWALWSPKSEPQLKDVQRLVDEFGAKGLKAVAVNAEGAEAPADLEARVKAFVQEHGITFPVVLDKELEQYNAWGVIATPATAFLGKDRKLTFEFSGHPTSAYEDMRAKVLEGLGIQEEVAEAHKPKRERYHPSDKKVTLSFGLARTQYDRGQFAKSLEKLEKVLEADPKYPDAHALNGALHLGLEAEGKAEAAQTAREAFQKAVELDPALPLGLAGLAHFALVDGDTAKALELSRKAVEHTEPDALPQLGSAESPEKGTPAEGAKAEGAKAEAGEAKVPGADRGAAVASHLDQAAKALEAGKADEAKALVAQLVDGLIALPEGPGAKARKMLEKFQKKP